VEGQAKLNFHSVSPCELMAKPLTVATIVYVALKRSPGRPSEPTTFERRIPESDARVHPGVTYQRLLVLWESRLSKMHPITERFFV